MIRFSCPTCKAALKVPPKLAGKTAPCPKCDDKIKIPMESEVDEAPAPRPAPSAPRTVPKPKPKPAADDEVIEDGFEVIDEEPKPKPKPKPLAPAPKPKSKAEEEEDDFEVVDDDEPKPKPKPKSAAGEAQAKPKPKIVVAEYDTYEDEEDPEDDGDDDRPVRRKKSKRKRSSSGFMGAMEEDNATYFKFLGISCAIIALLGGLLFVNFAFGIPLYLVVLGLAIYNLVWTIIICNREGGGWAVVLIFLGPCYFINLVRYWNPMWKPFVYNIATTVIFYGFLLAALIPAVNELKERNDLKQQQINQQQPNINKRK